MGTDQTSASSAQPVTIGQDNPILVQIEQGLISSGVQVAETALGAGEPWTQLPIVKFFVDEAITFGVTEIVNGIDDVAYQFYVSMVEAERVNDWIAAQASGSQAAIDAAGDNMLKLEGI